MQNVLVTGASGFVGSNLVEALLARGDRVSCLVRKTSNLDRLRPLDVELVQGDVANRDSLRRAVAGKEVVYHAAGSLRALHPKQLFQVNERGARNVAKTCAEQSNPPVLVQVSSLAAVGPSLNGRPRAPTDPPRPVSYYGRSKRAGELAVRRWADEVPITIVRPPMVLGKADRMGLKMFKSLSRFHIHLSPGLKPHRFSVIDARDLAQLLLLGAERGKRIPREETEPGTDRPRPRGCYFATSDEQPTYGELGRMLGKALGQRVSFVVPVALPVIWLIAFGVELTSHLIRRPRYLNVDKAREIAAGSWTCSAESAKSELGFRVGAPLQERLCQITQWYREQGWL